MQLGARYDVARSGGIRQACRVSCRRSDGSTKRRAIAAACRTGCRRIPIRCRAWTRSSQSVEKLKAGGSNFATNRDAFLRAHRRHHLRRQPGAGDRRAAASSCIRRCGSAIDFPQGWEVNNSPQQVVAKAPGADVYMMLAARAEAAGTQHPGDRARTACRAPGSGRCSGERTTINGLEAFVGVYQGQIEELGAVDDARRAHRARHATSTWWPGSPRPTLFQQADNAFLASHPLVPAAVGGRSGEHPARTASTSTSCARATRGSRSPSDRAASIKPATLAIMNNVDARRRSRSRARGSRSSWEARPSSRCSARSSSLAAAAASRCSRTST